MGRETDDSESHTCRAIVNLLARVTIHEIPGIDALNIVLEGALPGGNNASQRLDPAAKGFGQRLLGMGVGS